MNKKARINTITSIRDAYKKTLIGSTSIENDNEKLAEG